MALKEFLMIGAVAAVLAACGDDSSSNSASNSDEESSSSVCKNCDDSSSSKAKSSSSSAKSSSSEKKPCVVGKDKNCFEDERDGQTYRTVKIGTQIWMAENLNFKVGNSACYDDEKSNCTKYGRLYTWGAAIDSVGKYGENAKGCGNGKHCTPIPPVRGICPEGWHLPDTIEWRVLIDVAGGEDDAGKALKSKNGWKNDGNGTDEFGFSALPVGGRFGGSFDGDYFDEGLRADFWTSSYSYRVLGGAIDMGLMDNSDGVFMDVISSRVGSSDRGYSIRCLNDESTIPEGYGNGYVYPSTVVKGTMIDERDGQTYKTITVGSQTWMAENLNFETDNSFCYNDSVSYCERFGRLYLWSTAMDSAETWTTNGNGCGYGKECSPTYPVRGVCPEGWHLPDTTEWRVLIYAAGGESEAGKALKSASGWNDYEEKSGNGTDVYSFSALPAGFRYYYEGVGYDDKGDIAVFFSSTEDDRLNMYCMSTHEDDDGVELWHCYKDGGFSVRCVKDE